MYSGNGDMNEPGLYVDGNLITPGPRPMTAISFLTNMENKTNTASENKTHNITSNPTPTE